MVSENMANHQDLAFLLSQLDQFLPVFYIDGKGLLDENVFSGLQGRFCHLVMSDRRRSQGYRGDRRIGQNRAEIEEKLHAGILTLVFLLERLLRVTKRRQRSKFVEIPNQILSSK